MANVSAFTGAMPVIPGGTVELGYQALTATATNITYTGMPTTQSLIGPMTVVTDGSPLLVEFFAAEVKPPPVAGGYVCWSIYVDGSERTRYFGVLMNETTTAGNKPVYLSRRLNDVTAGSHTVEIRVMASTTSGTPAVYAATETSTSASAPAFLRVSKIVNQNDGLKPFWTPPVVTSLPSQATVGDQVIYAADATNGVYWQLQYDGLGTYPWKFIGGAPLVNEVTSSQSTTSTTNVDLATVGPSLTLVLAGDYVATASAQVENNTSGSYCCYSIFVNGVASGAEMQARMGSASQTLPTLIDRNITGSAANATVKLMYRSAVSGTANFVNRRLTITPIRVKAA